jgi:DNA-binding PucR family transcriptional regulator
MSTYDLIADLPLTIEGYTLEARELYCHRHTLRYRIRRVEELTGRDLSRARDRIEFWLALRGRELAL